MATTSSLSLCRQLLRTANGFTNYNFREYALRIIREDFKSKRALSGVEAVEARAEGFKQLQALERQVTVSKLFPQEKHAMESAVKS